MNEANLSSPTPTPTSSSELAELKELCADLRWQTHTLRIALLVVATAVCAFFWLEGRRNGQALTAMRPQAAQVIEASKVQDPVANKFVGQLIEFGKTHADFAAILNKYGVRENSTPAPASTVPAAPVPAVPKK
jgi:urease gamma subunit